MCRHHRPRDAVTVITRRRPCPGAAATGPAGTGTTLRRDIRTSPSSANAGSALIAARVTGRGSAARRPRCRPRRAWDRRPWVGIRIGHDPAPGRPAPSLTGVIDEGVVALGHRADVLERERVADPIPDRPALALELVERIGVGVGLQDPVVGHYLISKSLLPAGAPSTMISTLYLPDRPRLGLGDMKLGGRRARWGRWPRTAPSPPDRPGRSTWRRSSCSAPRPRWRPRHRSCRAGRTWSSGLVTCLSALIALPDLHRLHRERRLGAGAGAAGLGRWRRRFLLLAGRHPAHDHAERGDPDHPAGPTHGLAPCTVRPRES